MNGMPVSALEQKIYAVSKHVITRSEIALKFHYTQQARPLYIDNHTIDKK